MIARKYLGHIQKNDPLYRYLHERVAPLLDLRGYREWQVFKLQASNEVYLYEDSKSKQKLIGKFYHNGDVASRPQHHAIMQREYDNLQFMRAHGFDSGCHYVARPFGCLAEMNELLLEECCTGVAYSEILRNSILTNNRDLLYRKLTALAWFLSSFHNRTAVVEKVNFTEITKYANKIIENLYRNGWISPHRFDKLGRIFTKWSEEPAMWSDNQVIVHGDATPENFLFGDDLNVISFDLERLRHADRVYDLGRIVAETAHFFMLYNGNRWNAEPFIGHFIWEYCCHFPDCNAAFTAITRRVPFYMGINFLRIARNSYFDWNYRQRLINAGSECLKGKLS